MEEKRLLDKAWEITNSLTLEEKFSLLTGKDSWYLNEIKRVNLPSIMMTDGPHGVRKQRESDGVENLNDSYPSTCFPTYSLVACSFDLDLVKRMGEGIAKECREEDVAVLLGPGTNIKRSPLGGRNFEYFSEDPLLSGKLSGAFVSGVQSLGVGATLKHYACNNQEYARFINNSIVGERALHEIYLKPFEIAVKESKPWMVMSAYNLVNGTYASENKKLLTDYLRNDFGFDGAVVTDWGALSNIIDSFKNGLNIEMPGVCKGADKVLMKGLKKGLIESADIDNAVVKVVELILKAEEGKNIPYEYSEEENLSLARTVAEKSIVLAKNDKILPLSGDEKIALIGPLAKDPHYQGSGSSIINPIRRDNLFDVMTSNNIDFSYSEGYSLEAELSKDEEKKLLNDAKDKAKNSDVVVILCGLRKKDESEGFDRSNIDLPKNQVELVKKISKVNKNIIVVLQTGSVVSLPFLSDIKGLFISYLSGSCGQEALFNLMYGKVSPSGRLAETWVKDLDSVPTKNYFAVDSRNTLYKESIYVGYRYYVTKEVEVNYPFGYGLSYLDVSYDKIKIVDKKKSYNNNDVINIEVTVTNKSDYNGEEAVLVFAGGVGLKAYHPTRELIAFKKIKLDPKETKTIPFDINVSDLSFYNEITGKFDVEDGLYNILVCKDANDVALKDDIRIITNNKSIIPGRFDSVSVYYSLDNFDKISDDEFKTLLSGDIPFNLKHHPYDLNSSVSDLNDHFFGRFLLKIITKEFNKRIDKNTDNGLMAEKMFKELPLRALGNEKGMTKKKLDGICDIANGRLIRGLVRLLFK